LRPALRELYRRLGGQRLVWGSDMPNVERHCTYRQSLDYLEQFHDFIPAGDMGQILGGNLATLFGLA
jgi:predicted TIM-barrel fold metal-dependent hydrolase